MPNGNPAKIAVVGTGWRSEFYLRLAQLLPDEFELVGIVLRDPAKVSAIQQEWNVPTFLSIKELLAAVKPDFVIVAVPREVNPKIVSELVAADIKVLCETPPAADLDGLRKLWQEVGSSQLVQVAEQYLLLPGHAARLSAIKTGTIGTPTSVQVSSTHDYHAVSIMRGMLGAGFGTATINASQFVAPLVDPLIRDAWSPDQSEKLAKTVLATIDFGDGLSGLYDFTDNQWHNQLRHRRIVIRGSKGEIVDNDLISLRSPTAIVESKFLRYQLGHDLNLDGHDTEHISLNGEVIYQNPFVGLRLMDEEIAIATLMRKTAAWALNSGPEPYSLAEASQDFLISMALEKSLQMGTSVQTSVESWGK